MNRCKSVFAAMFFATTVIFGSANTISAAEKSEDLIVFAAASLTETLTELGNAFMADHENVNVIFTFDSSGTLKTQIQEGAEADIFISAGQKQMDQLDGNAADDINTENLDFVLQGSRRDLLKNKAALVVPEGNPAGIESYNDMVSGLQNGSILMAIGGADVPVGQYTRKLFEYYGLKEEELSDCGSITYGSNAKEVTIQVTEGLVDCGIIYQTDAVAAGLTVVDTATEEMCGPIIYPAAVMNGSHNPELANEFLAFLTADEAEEVFSKAGFHTQYEMDY